MPLPFSASVLIVSMANPLNSCNVSQLRIKRPSKRLPIIRIPAKMHEFNE